MKKLFFFAIAALGMTVACQKEVKVENPDIDDNAPVQVQFNVSAPSITVTKTKAAVENDWNNQDIYIYGYSDIAKADEYLISNQKASVAAGGNVTFADSKVFYYDIEAVYDFYGYYIDALTATPALTATKDSLVAEITIDGTQDVMLAKTDHNADMAEATSPVNDTRIYSAYAARRGVHPTLNFEHMLARFEFNVKKGESENNPLPVYVKSITVKSQATGKLTIAPADKQNFEGKGEKVDLSSTIITTDQNPYFVPTDSYQKAGEDLMIFPTTESDPNVDMLITLVPKENLNGNAKPEYKMPVTLKPSMFKEGAKTFDKAQKYVVNIIVYGLEEVSVTASLAEWGNGGEDEYDPDDDYAVTAKSTTLADGTKLYYFVQNIVVGALVYTDEKLENKAEAGDYTETDGRIITVDDNGRVESITYQTATKTLATDDSGAEVEVESPLYHAEATIAAEVEVFKDKTHKTAAEDGTYYDNAKVYTVLDGKVSVVRNYYKTVAKKASNSNTVTLFHDTETIETGTTLYTSIKFDNVVSNDTYIVGDKQYTVVGGTVSTVSDVTTGDNQ